MDLNLETMAIVSKCLGLEFDYNETTEYFHEVKDITDFRPLINGKKDTAVFEPYTQVFEEKHGFINNLSILDLLFNEGRYALDYLKKQEIDALIAIYEQNDSEAAAKHLEEKTASEKIKATKEKSY